MNARALFLSTLVLGCGASVAPGTDVDAPPDETPAPTPATRPDNPDPDADADPSAPSPEPPSLAPTTEEALFAAYAPHVYLHPDDPNVPANVDWYLPHVRLRFHHDGCPDHELLATGQVTQAALVAQSHPANRSLCRHDDAKVVTSTASGDYFLEVTNEAAYAGAPRAEWITYVVWRPAPGGLADLEYWFFYPYNDGYSVFNHEADWEHVRVRIDPTASPAKGAIAEVKLSAHHGGTFLAPTDSRLLLEDGTHPVAFVAKGSHANYPRPGTYAIEGTAGVAKETASAGAPVWKTEERLLAIGTRAAPRNGQLFVKYWGRWGQIGDLPESSGPTRHFP